MSTVAEPRPATWRIQRSGRALWARWTAATTVGEAIGFAVPAAVGAVAYALGVPDPASVLLAAVAGAGEGAILGAAQALVLREEIPAFPRRRWIAVTAAAAALCWALGMALGVYGGALPAAALVIAIVCVAAILLAAVGAAQWLVLRRHVPRAELWIPANAAAWLLGLPLTFVGMSFVDEGDLAAFLLVAGVVSGLGMALVVAAVTGLALVWLLRPAADAR
jgi:hypothetical protein